MADDKSQQPGLVGSHAEYAKGVIEPKSAIGDITGSKPWKESGEQDKASATSAMKKAGEQRDASSDGYGKAEELAGKLTGCSGMQKEGAASSKKE
ncbi:hypothetical protein L249_8730 [Ophiocordyceps polyrhachis-furcata BCC 54312]|uniref:CsbD-like domain-containing protein n=1 Tax=Ophiocordyceps polyrhachis-furcata BCC 54312 TaxID=1330021 RepID=A0A367L6H1_9HYPO|nr:hypothetical protein L249_8730 [Ophiocordyceps polyrhachis-furcata BCC 54312]